MLRTLYVLSLAALLSVSARAAEPAPLAPGKPAGVREARFQMNYPVVFTAAALAVVVGGLYLASRNNTAAPTGTSP